MSVFFFFFFFFKQKTAYEIMPSLVGSEMCIRDSYYVFEKLSGPVSTMMACPDGKKEKKFVTAGLGDDAMLRYNSKLPIVVYTPSNVDVKYRIWRADETIGNAVVR